MPSAVDYYLSVTRRSGMFFTQVGIL